MTFRCDSAVFAGLWFLASSAMLFAQTSQPTPPPPELQQANVEAKSYASAFKGLHAHLGRVYPAFEIKKIDWRKVGEELLPKADAVRTTADSACSASRPAKGGRAGS